jgi:hypothetical protein
MGILYFRIIGYLFMFLFVGRRKTMRMGTTKTTRKKRMKRPTKDAFLPSLPLTGELNI